MKKRNTIVTMGVVLVCFFAIGFTRYIDFPALHKGIPQTLQSYTKEMDLTLVNPQYYCLSSFIDSESLWKTRLTEQDLKLLTAKLKMHPIPSNQIGDHFLSMSPYWWQPAKSDTVRVLATTNFPTDGRGPDGWHAFATWNPEDGVIHMWIKDNF